MRLKVSVQGKSNNTTSSLEKNTANEVSVESRTTMKATILFWFILLKCTIAVEVHEFRKSRLL